MINEVIGFLDELRQKIGCSEVSLIQDDENIIINCQWDRTEEYPRAYHRVLFGKIDVGLVEADVMDIFCKRAKDEYERLKLEKPQNA